MSATTVTSWETGATSGTHLRLTRRGRLVVLLLLVAALFATFSFGRAATEASTTATDAVTVAPQTTTVQPGESLWTLARRIAPDNDPRAVVAQIRRMNDLSSVELRPGQQLLLPVAA